MQKKVWIERFQKTRSWIRYPNPDQDWDLTKETWIRICNTGFYNWVFGSQRDKVSSESLLDGLIKYLFNYRIFLHPQKQNFLKIIRKKVLKHLLCAFIVFKALLQYWYYNLLQDDKFATLKKI
jgi:hypothetical protein